MYQSNIAIWNKDIRLIVNCIPVLKMECLIPYKGVKTVTKEQFGINSYHKTEDEQSSTGWCVKYLFYNSIWSYSYQVKIQTYVTSASPITPAK